METKQPRHRRSSILAARVRFTAAVVVPLFVVTSTYITLREYDPGPDASQTENSRKAEGDLQLTMEGASPHGSRGTGGPAPDARPRTPPEPTSGPESASPSARDTGAPAEDRSAEDTRSDNQQDRGTSTEPPARSPSPTASSTHEPSGTPSPSSTPTRPSYTPTGTPTVAPPPTPTITATRSPESDLTGEPPQVTQAGSSAVWVYSAAWRSWTLDGERSGGEVLPTQAPHLGRTPHQ